jgi:hypothetical protein
LPSKKKDCDDAWEYNFEESIVLCHSMLVVPVMQHYGPLIPKLDLKGPTRKFQKPLPLLVVGMIGDCVKGKFFDSIKSMAAEGNQVAIKQKEILLCPERLKQKMYSLVRALLVECRQSDCGYRLRLDATLVGAGAFGGTTAVLAQPFADSLNLNDLAWESSDEVNFFMFPPPKPEEGFTLDKMKYKASLNTRSGLGAEPEMPNLVRVVIGGFDPISLAPHGVMNRAFSAEGQLCHATDLLQRLTGVDGMFVPVRVPKGKTWESPAAFFANPQEKKFKDEEGYDTVRFVPEAALESLGVEDRPSKKCVTLTAIEREPPRVWNGDSFEGWTLKRDGLPAMMWREILSRT